MHNLTQGRLILQTDICKMIHKDKYPKKVRTFIWEIILDSINTQDKIQKKNPRAASSLTGVPPANQIQNCKIIFLHTTICL